MRHKKDISNDARLSKNAQKKIESILSEVHLLILVEQPNETCQKVVSIVDCLPDIEKRIIQEKYLNKEAEYRTHQFVYESMDISEKSYRKSRQAAFVKIALGLELVDIFKVEQD